MKTKSLIFIALLTTLAAGAKASAGMPAAPVGVEIVADDGSVFARYDLADRSERGKLRAYLEAERGRSYGIRIRNRSGGRIGLVIAVDGRNILSGAPSYLRSNEPMYVLGPYEQATYRGWRTSSTQVHRFFFTEAADSYAEAWGDRSAMGVIAVAAFREVPRVQPKRQLKRRPGREQMAPAPGAPADSRAGASMESADAEAAPGTGFGDAHASPSVRVQFRPERRAFVEQFLKYEWHSTLVRLGVVPETPPANRFWPRQLGRADAFAPFPPGYWSRRH